MNETKAREVLPPLNKDILKTLKFTMDMHMNGGSKFSKIVRSNKEYGVIWVTETDGSPNYKITESFLAHKDIEIKVDLRGGDSEMQMDVFIEAYNNLRNKAVNR